MRFTKRRSPKRRSVKSRPINRNCFKPRFEALEIRNLLSGSPLPFDDSGLAPAGLGAICALPNLPVFNVLNYGAKGNGVSDDTLAIRSALSAAEAAGGGIIYLPTGTYAVDPQASDPVAWGSIFTITASNIVFIGDGAGNTHLNGYVEGLKNPITNWYVTGQSYAKIGRFSMFDVEPSMDVSGIQFRSLDINGQAGYTGNSTIGGIISTGDGWDANNKAIVLGFGTHHVDNSLIFNCEIRNWRGEEIYAGGDLLGGINIINCNLKSTNGSAISCGGTILIDHTTVGGSSAGDDVINGVENFNFSGTSTTIQDCTFMCSSNPASLHGNGVALLGLKGSSQLIQDTTFENNQSGILFSEFTHDVVVNNCTFTNNGEGMETSFLNQYPAYFSNAGFSNFTISNNTFSSVDAAFYSQAWSSGAVFNFPNLVLSGNTVVAGKLLSGAFGGALGSWTGFLVENNTLEAGALGIVKGVQGSNVALWSGTIRPSPSDPTYTNTGVLNYDLSGTNTATIKILSDLTVLSANATSPNPIAATIDPSILAGFPIGFTTTIYSTNLNNWTLKADPTWNTFAANIPLTPGVGVTIRVNSQGLFEVVNPSTSGTTSTATTVTSSGSTTVNGQLVTFTATVGATTPGAGLPTGSVTFKDGSTSLGTGTLDSTGKATFSTKVLAVGSHTISVSYGGDTSFAASVGNVTQTVNQASTSALVTSSSSTSVLGQSVTFTATLSANSPGSGVPTGSVTFLNGSTTLGTGTLDSTGKATFSTTALAVGSHTISVSYGGSASFAASLGNMTQTVNQASTSALVTSSGITSVFGQSVTFTVTLSANAPGAGVPTGNVNFVNGSTTLGTSTLDSTGKATFSTAGLVVGSHAISVSYAGDGNFAASVGNMTQTVNPAPTSTAAISSASPSTVGQAVTFTATVSDTLSAMPTGNVTFFDGTTQIGTGTLDSTGKANFSTAALTTGNHAIKVSYSGCAYCSASSAQFTQTVGQPAKSTTTTLTSSAKTSVFGQSATFTATVKAGTSPVTTGYVTFLDGASTVLGYGSLNTKGVAMFKTSTFVVGTHTIVASYSGTTSFATSAAQLTQTVNPASTGTTIASSASTSVFDQLVTFTATVTTKAPGTGVPTGTVTFLDGSTVLGTGTLNAIGKATFSTAAFGVGSHSITAAYGGSVNSAASAVKMTQAVKAATTITTISSSASSSAFGQWVTFTAIVTAKSPSSAIPTGTVKFLNGTTVIGTGTLDASGKATFTSVSLAIGSHTITASYVAIPSFAASSAKLTQVVSQAKVTAAVSSSVNASVFGQSVTFTASITAIAAGSLVPTGSVVFLDGKNVLGTSTLDPAGNATFTTAALSAGNHVITVSYTPGKNYATPTATMTQTVNQATTSTTLISSANPSILGQPVTFTASVVAAAPGAGIPAGKVTFFDGTTVLATVLLDATGQATFTSSALDAGDHVITAFYDGVPNFAVSSGLLTQSVIIVS